ncbi:MAG: hypothetical protein IRZ28_08955 [Steroidobacteraceae bacterium]|nr:hypothetical protein [Steroidobacteraceae bacterium]
MRTMLWIPLLAVSLVGGEVAVGATAQGRVQDAQGNPISNTTVLVYSAGVRTGYSIFCPTCYADCGKRTSTDDSGQFSIPGLADDLVFDLLVLKDGYSPEWIKNFDPLKGVAASAALTTREPIEDVRRVLRGRVVDAKGRAVAGAVVEGSGMTYMGPDGHSYTWWVSEPRSWSDKLAVTNENGEFELAASRPLLQMSVRISPRAMAPSLFSGSTGAERHTITLTSGATVHGRLLANGKPVPGVELGLVTSLRDSAYWHPEVRIATDERGRFAFTNVPPGRVWELYAIAESFAGRGAVKPVLLATGRDGDIVDVGDVHVERGLTLSGRIVLTDGKAIPEGMRLLIGPTSGGITHTITLPPDGRFTVSGLLEGAYALRPSVLGYEVPAGVYPEVLVKRDVKDYVLPLAPSGAEISGVK